MNWIHIWFCLDCQRQIQHGFGNEPDFCDCEEELAEEEDPCICIPDEPNTNCPSCY